MNEFDYVIVGGGTAGCVLANRLSADPGCRVLLLEAGRRARGLWPRMPAGTARMFNRGPYNWGFETEPEPGLNDRRIYAPRGKGLGGSGLINGMVFVRGQAEDFDSWAGFGVRGWGWQDVLPHYRSIESREGGSDAWRGRAGEIRVTDPLYRHPASIDFVSACTQAGIAPNEDLNGERSSEGTGFLQLNIRDGERLSADGAFLAPVASRRNLTVIEHAHVCRVLLRDGQAVGVDYLRDGVPQQALAHREVVLASGAFGSPLLLMRSGIGPGEHLREHGIDVATGLPGVGQNLQDHFYVHSIYGCTPGSSLNRDFSGWRALVHGARYLLTRRGPLTMGASQSVAFVKSLPSSTRADTQINFKPVTWSPRPDGSVSIMGSPEFCAASCYLRPASRGSVDLRSRDPADAPSIRANYLSAPEDRQAVLGALRIVRGIFGQPAMRGRVVAERLPGEPSQDDESLLAYARQHGASMHHWVGTCRMGSDDLAVVDERLRVRGVGRLRVVDASVMPLIPSANTHAPTFMVASRAAQLILEDAKARVPRSRKETQWTAPAFTTRTA